MSLAHVLSQTTLSLQIKAGCPISFCRTVPTEEPGVYQVVVEYSEEAVGKKALELAEQLCEAAWHNTPFDVTQPIADLAELDEDIRLGPSTGCIVEAAKAHGIPFRRLTEGSLVQFGWGAKQRRIQAAEMDSTGAIAESIAQDKELTKTMLAAAGVPVPEGRPVTDAEDAWLAAQEIGAPNVAVVVKPQDGNQGKGVTVNVCTREAVMAGFENARKFRDNILVERYLVGSDYRILIVGDKLIAAARREPPLVVGDGEKMPCALIQPDFAFAKLWAQRKNMNIGSTPQEMAQNQELKKRIVKDIAILNESLGKWEQIKKIELTPEVWSIEEGLLTPTMKLKRKAIKEKFFTLYEKLYDKA